jgi:hypothetical protein
VVLYSTAFDSSSIFTTSSNLRLFTWTFIFGNSDTLEKKFLFFVVQCWRSVYTLFNKNHAALKLVKAAFVPTSPTVANVIRVVFSYPVFCIHGVFLSSIHYSQSCRTSINQRHQYVCLLWS